MDAITLWRMDADGSLDQMKSASRIDAELHLEELLVAQPELLEPGLQLIGRQTPAAGGWLDLLGVDGDGRLVVYELKRGTLGRDAVTQVLDYTSFLAELPLDELTAHISDRSGQGGIPQFNDFAAWYEDQFGDLQGIFPLRSVLVGLGIDRTAARIARFLAQAGGIEVEIITLFGFRDDQEPGRTYIARQTPAEASTQPPAPSPKQPSIEERRRLLKQYLEEQGLTTRFHTVQDAILEQLQEAVFVDARKSGVSLRMSIISPSGARGPRPYFGIYAAYTTPGAIEISLNGILETHHREDLEQLAKQVECSPWPHGGRAIVLRDETDWERARPAICAFASAVHQRREQYRSEPLDSADHAAL